MVRKHEKIEPEARKMLQKELNRAAFEVKEFKFSLGLVNGTREQLKDVVVQCGVTIDAKN